MFRLTVLAAVLVVGGISGAVAGYQQTPNRAVREIQKVRDNLYFIPGGHPFTEQSTFSGGNTGVLVTERGVVLVDTMLPGSGRGILERLKSVTDKPVIMIINTHTHNDHSGSNTEFSPTVEFVAHENTKANMSKATCEPVTNCQSFKGENAKYLPKTVFKDKTSVLSGKDRIDLYYFGRGHTDGDAWVVFPAVRAMQAGDLLQLKHIPLVDRANNNGSAVAFDDTIHKAFATIKNVDTIIAGHDPSLWTWADFKEYTEFYGDFVKTVRDGKTAGKQLDEIVKGYHVPAKYKGYSANPQFLQSDAQEVYEAFKK
jgi:glyoxylase-like metal-dependent hydrolase (beta-lactamase superfamily II)